MKSSSTGFWLTVGLVLAIGLIGTVEAIARRVVHVVRSACRQVAA